jgi:hypothetical protein
MGYGNISGMTSTSRGFTANRLMGYAESHDEEDDVQNLQFGNTIPLIMSKNLNIAFS